MPQTCGKFAAHSCSKFVANAFFVCKFLFWRTVLAHNIVRRKFAAHSCRALYWHTMRRKYAAHSCRALFWHTMCATSLRRTVAVHCAVLPQPPPTSPPSHSGFITPTPIFFLVPYPQGEYEKKWGDGRSVTKNKNLGVGKNVGVGDGRSYMKNKNLGVGVAVFNPGGGGWGWFDIVIAKKN